MSALICALALLPSAPARADATYQALPYNQSWTDTGLISADDNWSAVPGAVGYLGDGLTSATGADPQTILTEGTATVDVIANQASTATLVAGGVAELELANPAVALQGSGTADAPSLVLYLNATGQSNITVSYNLRDLDGNADDAAQQVALQFRVGASGNFTNVPAGYVADATTGGSATQVTPVSALLPAEANNQPQLQIRIITTNAAGSDEWVGIDDIAVSGGGTANAPITPTCGAALATTVGVAASRQISASDADGVVTGAQISAGATGGITLDAVTPAASAGGVLTATLNVAATVPAGSYAVQISFANSDSSPQSASCTVNVTVAPAAGPCVSAPADLAAIGAVQGSGDVSPRANQTATVRGVVTGDFQGGSSLSGFYIQDPAGDGDPLTSDGIFVFVPAANPLSSTDVVTGEAVQVSGTVREFNGQTELDTVTDITKCGTPATISPATITLPEQVNGELERLEGMLVSITQTLTVQQNFFQGRYGQVTLGLGRLFQPTNLFRPATPEAQALADLNNRSLLVLDDASSNQNPNPIPYIGAGNTLRAGDTVSGLTGVLDFGPINSNSAIRDYRLQPTAAPTITRVNTRPEQPDAVGGNVKVASFNVLNYFTTIDQAGAQCFPSNTRSDCRGADSAAELQRQQAKIVAALKAIDADVVGLIEIENNGATAVGSLVDALNAATAPNTYAAIADPIGVGPIDQPNDVVYPGGDDAIRVALIYKPARLTPLGAALAANNDAFELGRAPVAQAFRLSDNGEAFSVIINHFKSKNCDPPPAGGNVDAGQGCYNELRVQQAQALLTFLGAVQAASGDTDVLVIGDLNAYGQEDPVATLTAAGLVNLSERFVPAAQRYSYVFDGLAGELDHALATASLSAQASGATIWHINADEPSVIDYNAEFKPQDLYAPTAFRSSDHDPAIIGLRLGASNGVGTRLYLPIVAR